MGEEFAVTVGSGTLRSSEPTAVTFPHRWTDTGVTVLADFTGAHLLHLAAAGCVLNDVHREAGELGVEVAGVRVIAHGSFDPSTWTSTGIGYAVEIDSPARPEEIARLVARVDEVAEIPRALRAGTSVLNDRAPATGGRT